MNGFVFVMEHQRFVQVPRDYGSLTKNGMGSSKPMLINENEDDEMEIRGYRTNKLKSFFTYFGIIGSFGFLRLFFHWVPHWYLFATSTSCPITEAEKILVIETFKDKHKIYHVKSLKTLTSDTAVNMKNNEKVIDPQIIEDLTNSQPSLSVNFENGHFRELDKLIMFSCKKVTYIWHSDTKKFVRLKGLDQGVSSHKFHENKGLTRGEAFMRRLVYGPNKILVKESSIAKLLFLEVLNPFYIFQIASFILWFLDNYYYYATAIFIMSMFGISMTVIQTKKNEKSLRSTVHSSDVCTVLRKSSDRQITDEHGDTNDIYFAETISTDLLVPGDVLEIPAHGCIMHCDALLLTGNCILNESMLTGESVPVTKTSLPNIKNVLYDPKEHARHTLFCGTQVIQTRYFGNEKVLAVVVRTGFSTAKGSLVRSILYPPPVDFKFEKDSYKFVAFMACIALVGFTYTIITKLSRHVPISDLILEACDLITIVIPPALPAAMTVGCFYAQIRLKKNQIFCISPRNINVSGSINCVCFDKTGTLTEDGLDLLCIAPIKNQTFTAPVEDASTLPHSTLLYGLVSCHSLTIIDKQIVGDPLDLKMVESTKWTMEDPEVADNNKFDMIFPTVMKPPKQSQGASEIGIIREFPFSSSLQRMGVIVRRIDAQHFEYYCKGSPEMILNFVTESSIPDNFSEVLENYTQDGCRVIAIAHKQVRMQYAKIHKVQRETLEKDMELLGLIVLENRLKPETTPCIKVLNEANIRIVMVTGDNILTALSVARDCDIVRPNESVITVNVDNANPPNVFYTINDSKSRNNDVSFLSNSASIVSLATVESQLPGSLSADRIDSETCNRYRFAMTGKVWGVVKEYHSKDLLSRLVTRGTIFARMSPEQKQQLVQELQDLGYYVAMCGDGANDCGALKAAHTGVSLSDAESSVASPFTSKNANISCIINVIKEGRAALVTSFGIFKYMTGYSLCQFISVLLLYSMDSNLTDMEFLYIDLFIISVFAFFFGKTSSYPGKLVRKPPLTSLLSLSPILSLILQLMLIGAFQVGAFLYLKEQPWYEPFKAHEDKDEVGCVENYTIFTISSFQYITLALVFSKGKPYRKTIFSNLGFILATIILLIFSVYLALIPSEFVRDFFKLVVPASFDFRLVLVCIAAVYFALSFLTENIFIDCLVEKKLSRDPTTKYSLIENELKLNTKWPTLTSATEFTAASPENTMQSCTAEIVVEKENKFDKNHVLNKLYTRDNSSSPSNRSVCSENLTERLRNKIPMKTISDNNLRHNKNTTSDTNLLNKQHFAVSEDIFSSVPSEFNGISSSDTFKSFSPDGSILNELPYDTEEFSDMCNENKNLDHR